MITRSGMRTVSSCLCFGVVMAWLAVTGEGCVGDDANTKDSAPPDAPAGDVAVLDGAVVDVATDVVTAACDTSKPFGIPINLTEINTSGGESEATLTSDQLTMYFSRGYCCTRAQISVASRPTIGAQFGAAVNLNFSLVDVGAPFVTPDGGTLYFDSNNPDAGTGWYDIFMTSPPSSSQVTRIDKLSSTKGNTFGPWILPDESEFFLASARDSDGGGQPVQIYSGPIVSGVFGSPTAVANVNSNIGYGDRNPVLTGDGLTMYLTSSRGDPNGDIYVATRSSKTDTFGTPALVTELATTDQEVVNWISADGCTIYFTSTHQYTEAKGGFDLYYAKKP